MTTPELALRPAGENGLDVVESLLERNDLPTDDVHEGSASFYVARVVGEHVGVGGLEVHGADGLLRSVVVEESSRGQGYGVALGEALERNAEANGIETLYLLTTTAAAFFERQGYVETARADAPTAIRSTAEFEALCPDGATCMRKRL